jgi:hypothetical protein
VHTIPWVVRGLGLGRKRVCARVLLRWAGRDEPVARKQVTVYVLSPLLSVFGVPGMLAPASCVFFFGSSSSSHSVCCFFFFFFFETSGRFCFSRVECSVVQRYGVCLLRF